MDAMQLFDSALPAGRFAKAVIGLVALLAVLLIVLASLRARATRGDPGDAEARRLPAQDIWNRGGGRVQHGPERAGALTETDSLHPGAHPARFGKECTS